MSTQPFLPLFFGDLLAATPTWEGEQRALYVLLLAYQWTAGPLPTDPKKIAKMCQYDVKTFTRLWITVGKKFVETEDGLINARLEEHRVKAKGIAEKRANAGAKGAANRWQRPKQEDDKPMANAIDLSCHPSHPIPSEDSRRGEAPPGINPPDPRKAMFDLGVTLLGEKSRGLIGKAVSQIGEKKVAEILGAMAVKPPVDPVTYFAKATKPEERKVAV
jgi:uncharacterized protein YdaU (DUF1376 family)